MKNILLLFVVLMITSCADDVMFPSSYEYTSTSYDSYNAFILEDGEFFEVDIASVPELFLTVLNNTVSISKIEFISGSQAIVTDGFITEEVTYGGTQAGIWFDKGGQRIEVDGSLDGNTFEVRSIVSADFDGGSQNVLFSVLCGEINNCFSLDPFAWIGHPNFFSEGDIQYVILRRDVLTKV